MVLRGGEDLIKHEVQLYLKYRTLMQIMHRIDLYGRRH